MVTNKQNQEVPREGLLSFMGRMDPEAERLTFVGARMAVRYLESEGMNVSSDVHRVFERVLPIAGQNDMGKKIDSEEKFVFALAMLGSIMLVGYRKYESTTGGRFVDETSEGGEE